MTVKELHTFTDADMDTITDALKIANAHYRMMAEVHSRNDHWGLTFERQAHEAGELKLKIEAGQ